MRYTHDISESRPRHRTYIGPFTGDVVLYSVVKRLTRGCEVKRVVLDVLTARRVPQVQTVGTPVIEFSMARGRSKLRASWFEVYIAYVGIVV